MKTIAIIGPGKSTGTMVGHAIGHAHAMGIQTMSESIRMLGVDINEENLKAFGERFQVPEEDLFTSTEALYEALTPDLVSICTWPGLHAPMALEAMERGVRSIIVEKPLALDMTEIREVQAKAEETGACVSVAHQRRYGAHFKRVKEIVESGEIGDQLQVQGFVGHDWDILSWTVHWFDMANYWFNGPAEFVLSGMDVTEFRRYNHAVENASTIYLDYGERGTAQFTTGPGVGAQIRVVGSKGMVVTSDSGSLEVWSPDGYREETPTGNMENMFAGLYRETLEGANGGPEPLCSLKRCLHATETAYAAQESARTARKITLPLQTGFAPLEILQHPVQSALKDKTTVLFADTHCNAFGRDGIAEALTDLTGMPPRLVNAEERGLKAEDLEGADLLLLYHFEEHGEESFNLLKNWVESGKPALIMHGALGAYKDRDIFKTWCGRIWDWDQSRHPHEACILRGAEGNPVDFDWSEGWLPKDEIYVDLTEVTPVTECLTAETASGSYPAAWISSVQPNVGCWMPGHRPDCFQVPAMRQGMERMMLHLLKR